MQPQADFTADHRAALASFARDLGAHLGHPVAIEYGSTDCGRDHWAALCDDKGDGTALVSILTGASIGRDGFAVTGCNGVTLADGVRLKFAMAAARRAAIREHAKRTRAARSFAG